MREIDIEETPNGCVLSVDENTEIVVSSKEDAEAIIESLQKMISAVFPETKNSEGS